MSNKSTPLSELRKKNAPAPQQPQQPPLQVPEDNDTVDNELVNEILREIEEEPQNNDIQNTMHQAEPQPQQQYYQEQMPPVMMQQPAEQPEEPKDLIDIIKDNLYIAAIVFVLSLPIISNNIKNVLPKKDFIVNNMTYVLALVKGVIALVLSYLYQNFA